MMDFGGWAFRNKGLVYFFVAVFVLGGVWSAYEMSKLEDPEIKVKLAMIATTYPGASAHQVELEVTDVLEKKVREMGGISNIESWSQNDLSLIQVELLSTVANDEVDQYWDRLRRKVQDARSSLPAGAGDPIVQDDFGNVYGLFFALTGEGIDDGELLDYAELIKRSLSVMECVDRVELYGGRKECINVYLSEERMSRSGVKPAEVLSTLDGQNATTYTGYFENGVNRFRVDVSDRFRTAKDIGELIIQGHVGDRLRLKDIAKVEKGFEDPVRNDLFYDGQRAIGILAAAATGTDIVKVGSVVEKELKRIEEERLPVGVECHKVFYQPERVTDALGTFALNLVESVAIVVLILMLVMGFKSGWIIGTSLCVTVAGSFLVLYSLNGTLQRVSLASFILAMGMLVDNAIVIIDGIMVDLRAGKSRREAMTAIGRQTGMPLLGATLIAILAFLPIFMSPDTAGEYTRDLFIVLAVSLLLSWVLALVHVPLMADKRLFPKVVVAQGEDGRYRGRGYVLLRCLLCFCLRHRIATIVSLVVLFGLSLGGYRLMKQGFFPDMVYDQLYMEYKLPEGTHPERVRSDLKEIETYLKSRSDVRHVTMSLGASPGRYCLVRSIPNPSLSYGELIIDFASPRALNAAVDEIQLYLSSCFPDAYVKLKLYNLMFKKYPIEAQFSGPDPAVLHALADSARSIMERSSAVRLVTTNWEPRVPVLNVEFDQPAARALGLSRKDVSMSLLTATSGIPVSTFYEGIRPRTIYLKSVNEQGEKVENLSNAQVFSTLPMLAEIFTKETMAELKAGTMDVDEVVGKLMETTPLKQVSKSINVGWEDPVVPRYDGQRCQSVQCSPIAGMETEKARSIIAEEIESIPLPAGYSLQWQGERKASKQSMKYLFKNFPLSIILMIGILIMLFKDYRKPMIIFCCIPLVLVGVVAVMLVTGKTFNFVAIVGTLGLIGMLIKNGIVLMDEIVLQLGAGVEPVKALVDSAQSRLRPVAMAALTTMLGMIPLLSDAMFGSLAATIMGGLLFGTIITLVAIPVLYALFFNIKYKR